MSMRKRIFDKLNILYPTYFTGQHSGICAEPIIVIKYGNSSSSSNTSKAGWQIFEVMVYAPISSILVLDEMEENVLSSLKNDFEFTGDITPDFIDTDKQAWMRSIKYRIPKTI